MSTSGARIQGVQALHLQGKPWVNGFPVCPPLNQHHILHMGIREIGGPTKIGWLESATTFFVATMEGRGRISMGSESQSSSQGNGCLMSVQGEGTFEPQNGSRWKFCWVCYNNPAEQREKNSFPIARPFDSLPLQSAILGLVHECAGRGQPNLIQEWTDLAHAYVWRFAKQREQDDGLNPFWERLVTQLSTRWTLKRLADEAGYSSEHLRRLCRAHFGRSPMQQLSYLRLRRAADMLVATDHTIEAIAKDVGYQNPFVFSNAFTKWIGWRPSEYRRKRLIPSSGLRAA
jgi:AraC-like DNA-binding protein